MLVVVMAVCAGEEALPLMTAVRPMSVSGLPVSGLPVPCG